MSKAIWSVLLAVCGVVIVATGALGGIYLYTRAYGSPADMFASRAADYFSLLHQSNGLPRGVADIADKVRENLDMEIVVAGSVFDRMDAKHQRLFRDVLAKTIDVRKVDAGNTEKRNDVAQYSAKVRSCILEGNGSDHVKADCARKAIASLSL